MRVLCNDSWNANAHLIAMDVTYITYDESRVKGYSNGSLFLVDSEGERWYIPNVTRQKANNVCTLAFSNGYVDLTSLGQIFIEDELDFEEKEEENSYETG